MFDINIILDEESERSSEFGRVAPIRHLALIGNALPRKCGIATFTSHVADALRQRFPAMKLDHYAMDDGSGVEYPPEIRTIAAEDTADSRLSDRRAPAIGHPRVDGQAVRRSGSPYPGAPSGPGPITPAIGSGR